MDFSLAPVSLLGDEEGDIPLYDKVLQYEPLLLEILSFCHDPKDTGIRPVKDRKAFLSLRLVSSAFNEAVLGSNGLRGLFRFRLPVGLDDGQVASLETRLCRDVSVDFKPYIPGLSTTRAVFSRLVKGHGLNVLILNLVNVPDRDLTIHMTLINQGCPNLRKLVLSVITARGPSDMAKWTGQFDHDQRYLEVLEITSDEATRKFEVGKILTSFLERATNLHKLTIVGDIAVTSEHQNFNGLKYFKQRDYRSDSEESLKSIVGVINAAANTLEEVNLRPMLGSAPRGAAHVLPLQPLPSLRRARLTIDLDIDNALDMSLWNLILEGGTKALETLEILRLHGPARLDYFWPRIFEFTSTLDSVKTLMVPLGSYHPSTQIERLQRLSIVFPKLSRLAFRTSLPHLYPGSRAVFVQELLQCLSRWTASLKEVQVIYAESFTINDVAAAFEAVGEGFFTCGGLASLRVATLSSTHPLDCHENMLTDEQFSRLTRTLLWARNMKLLAFHRFNVPRTVTTRLVDFISANKLPVRFFPNEVTPEFST